MGIDSWAYQLQNINISEISSNSTFKLIVIDYSSNGEGDGKFSAAQIAQIRNSGKKAISYISIGEAENYRYYWNSNWDADSDGNPDPGAPAWLGPVNPQWEGNYKVRFWDSEWQNIIFAYVDTLIAQGFDGIYCDIIDAYYYWSVENPEEPLADSLMIQFVLNMREHISQKTDEDFHIIPQNGEFVVNEQNVSDSLKLAYFGAIQGIGVEDVFFSGDLDQNNPFDPQLDRTQALQEYLDNNINVFSVEYLTDSDLISQYLSQIKSYGFVPYVALRALNVLNNGIVVSAQEIQNTIPQSARLYQNYPNPLNLSTTIEFSLPRSGYVTLIVYTTLGEEVARLVSETLSAGRYSVDWNASGFASGVYLYRLQAATKSGRGGESVETKKMVVLK